MNNMCTQRAIGDELFAPAIQPRYREASSQTMQRLLEHPVTYVLGFVAALVLLFGVVLIWKPGS